MAKYDLEDLADDIKDLIKDNLNTYLLAITQEKNDEIELKPVQENAWIFQDMNSDIANNDPFVLYTLRIDENISDGGPHIAEKCTITFVLILVDDGNEKISRMLFRYRRAMKDIVAEKWNSVKNGNKLSVSGLDPISFESMNGAEKFKAVGINIEVSLG